jgi:hypothetical protein
MGAGVIPPLRGAFLRLVTVVLQVTAYSVQLEHVGLRPSHLIFRDTQ